MATRYQQIDAMQTPFDLGLDANNRARVGFNIMARKDPSTTFEEELVKILEDANIGTFGTTIFVGGGASIPGGPVGTAPRADLPPSLHITPTGGPAPERVHNQVAPSYHMPTAQLVARALDYASARNLAWSAFNALVAIRNVTVTL